MEVTETDIARIPAENLHVPRAEFAAVWAAAEQLHEDCVRRRVSDWYGAGVVMTCRWLAVAMVRPQTDRWYMATAPVTERTGSALPELIQAEALAAQRLDLRRPAPGWLLNRPGWLPGVLATFDWVWWRKAGPPVQFDRTAVG